MVWQSHSISTCTMIRIIFILLFGWLRFDALFYLIQALGRTEPIWDVIFNTGKQGGSAISIFLSSVAFWAIIIGGYYYITT